jgi:hypothetical protein
VFTGNLVQKWINTIFHSNVRGVSRQEKTKEVRGKGLPVVLPLDSIDFHAAVEKSLAVNFSSGTSS